VTDAAVTPAYTRARLRWEVVLVLSATFGASAVYSLLRLVRRRLSETPLSQQSTQLNPTLDTVPVWDIVYNCLDVFFDLMLVGLVVYLLWEPGRNALRAMGMDFTRIGQDLARGALFVVVIGVPGIGLYLLGRLIGVTVAVQASESTLAWWSIGTLVLSALRSGVMEEVIMIGWLFDRFRRLGVGPVATIVTSALIRGAYHSYQGEGPMIGNILMGLVFGWLYLRWKRVMPLVIAHTLIDVIAFIGYPLALASPFLAPLFAPAS
jgi:uncharacterized protein